MNKRKIPIPNPQILVFYELDKNGHLFLNVMTEEQWIRKKKLEKINCNNE